MKLPHETISIYISHVGLLGCVQATVLDPHTLRHNCVSIGRIWGGVDLEGSGQGSHGLEFDMLGN